MKKTRLKLKKKVWVSGLIILFLILAIYVGKNIYQDYEYKQTDEYKLLEKGYTKEEIKILEENLDKETFNKVLESEKNTFLVELMNEKYYIKDNFERYLAFQIANPTYETSRIVALVNTYNDYTKYDYNITTDLSKDYLVIVNKYYHLEQDYEPSDLVNINNKYYYGDNHKIRKVVYEAFIDMWNQAFNEDIYLIINSSFRNYEDQKQVYDSYKNTQGTTYADTIAARPGYSEHQTGLALDIFSKQHTSTSNFKNSPAHIWLQNNAYRFGFIERYQETNEEITGFEEEAWHWRYVGVEAATYIYENNISFDEYYAYYIAKS